MHSPCFPVGINETRNSYPHQILALHEESAVPQLDSLTAASSVGVFAILCRVIEYTGNISFTSLQCSQSAALADTLPAFHLSSSNVVCPVAKTGNTRLQGAELVAGLAVLVVKLRGATARERAEAFVRAAVGIDECFLSPTRKK